MASSGSKEITVTSWDKLKFSWWENSQSVANNTTTIGWKLELIATSSGAIRSTISKDWSVTVNGTAYSGTNTVNISNNVTKALASGTTTITHNADGTKTFSYSFSQEFAITFSGSYIGTKSGSGSGTLDTISRKSTLSVADGTLNTEQTLTVTRLSTSFTHTIVATCGSASSTICTKSTSTSIPFTPPLSLANQNTTGTSVSVTYTITTYNGNTNIGSNSYTKTCSIPSSVKPSVSVSVTDAMGYATTFGDYIQGKSKLKIVVTASGSYGSTIQNYRTTANGKTYTNANFTTAVVSNNGTLTINTTVTDSRSRTNTASTTVSVLPYSAPKITELKVFRCDAEGYASSSGEHLAIVFDSTITPLNNKNTAKYELQHKKSVEKNYTTKSLTGFAGQYSVSDGVFVLPAEKNSSYNITLVVTDDFGSVTKTAIGASIKKWFSILKTAFGFAIGKIAELPNVFDIALQTRFLGGILHPVLEPNTDLNDVLTPNTYVGANLSTYKYLNCPLTSGTFSLEVVGMGEEGQVKQRLTYCHKTESRTWERIYYQSSWGDWICVSDFDGQLLWDGSKLDTGGAFMHTESQNISLPEKISKQKNGIVLVFQGFNPTDKKTNLSDFNTFFIPKKSVIDNNGRGRCFICSTTYFGYLGIKYLYIYDNRIETHAGNDKTGTAANGITYTNNRFVLTKVYGV